MDLFVVRLKESFTGTKLQTAGVTGKGQDLTKKRHQTQNPP
jgi:hypothetical protein